ncbi:MAG: heparan-alpha-glucosaminide N-acetyltransferase domain-containing protein [Promethearchaeota archaeon]
MELKRIKSIDVFRGLCMAWMVLDHLIDWWILREFHWVQDIAIMIIDSIGASGFLFISGVSITISYRRRLNKANISDESNIRIAKNAYFFRAVFILIIAIIYNIPTAIFLANPSYLWTWFVLLTSAISIFMVWPLLYTSKIFRILFGIFIIIINQFLMNALTPYQGEFNILGILYHILYNDIYQDPILSFFPFFLFGTIFGDILFKSYLNINSNEQKQRLKRDILVPTILIGISLIVIGVMLYFPEISSTFLIRQSFSWIIYSLGIEILLLSLFLLLEKFIFENVKKSFKLLFYYSYYSLTVYIGHNLLYFLFFNLLNPINIWFFIAATFFLLALLLRLIYKRFDRHASIKILISRLSLNLAIQISKKKTNKN